METTVDPRKALLAALSVVFCMTVARRIVCAVLLAYNISETDAAAFAGVCRKSARKYNKILYSADASGLLYIAGGGHPSKLSSVRELILAELDKGMYRTLRQIKLAVKQTFGIEISRSRISVFIKTNGYRLLRCASLPAKANFAEQRRFYKEELLHLMAGAKRNELVLQFMDAAHFVYGTPTPGAVYTRLRRSVRTFSGRMRHNVLASMDYISKQVTTLTNDTYITATQVVELLEKLSEQYIGKTIVVVMDNVRYQRCEMVQACADRLDITLCYLPPYSPNLNLIERYWRYIKGEVLNAAYLDTFDKYKLAITNGIHDSYTMYKDRLDSLINYRVQLYDDKGIALPFDQFVHLNRS